MPPTKSLTKLRGQTYRQNPWIPLAEVSPPPFSQRTPAAKRNGCFLPALYHDRNKGIHTYQRKREDASKASDEYEKNKNTCVPRSCGGSCHDTFALKRTVIQNYCLCLIEPRRSSTQSDIIATCLDMLENWHSMRGVRKILGPN